MSRARVPLLVVLVALVLPLAWVMVQPAPRAEAATSVEWGFVAAPRDGRSRAQEAARVESLVGRQFTGLRTYDLWDSPFPNSDDLWYRDTGHELWLSVKPHRSNGTVIRWSSIAAATPGTALYADMERWAQRIRDYGAVTHVIFNHEMETSGNTSKGTPAEFIAAWRTWVSVFREVGVPNARFTWVATAYAFRPGAPNAAQNFYPGDAYVDEIGADGYNWLDCRDGITNAPRSFAEIFTDFRNFGAAHPGIPLVVPEWGSAESSTNPNEKANWITAAQATLKQPAWSQFTYVNYFHARHSPTSRCIWHVDTSPQSLAAFTAMGQDPYFSGGAPPDVDPTAAFSFSCSALSCAFDGSASADPGGTITAHDWDFGDGTADSGVTPTHVFPAAGTYPVTLTVTDDTGATGSVSRNVTVSQTSAAIAFRGAARFAGNVRTAPTVVPTTVTPGDALLLFATVNVTAAAVSGPSGVPGWTPLANFVTGSQRTMVWEATAAPGVAGATVTLQFDRYTKVVVQVLAYGGTSSDPVAAVAVRAENQFSTTHTSPTVPVVDGGAWLVSYWADKTSSTTSWTPPGDVTMRDVAYGTGSGYISAMVADSAGPVPAGTAGGLTATTNASSVAASVSVVLRP
jgi:PKD repeat protein